MTEYDALLAAVRRDQRADAPRLVLADWLEENGEGEYAGFIRDGCGILKAHTDCPVRLADLKAGRPVPLRCGACDYCTARRRSEAYYGKAPWWAGGAYAVCFEPSPLDGAIPFAGGTAPTFTVRRGFVEVVACPLLTWCGGEMCSRCEGDGVSMVADYHRWRNCKACSGTGRTPGIGRQVVAACPGLVEVRATDREPARLNTSSLNKWGWYDAALLAAAFPGETGHEYGLPPEVFALLDGGTRPGGMLDYPTRDAAQDALSAAMLALGKNDAHRTPTNRHPDR